MYPEMGGAPACLLCHAMNDIPSMVTEELEIPIPSAGSLEALWSPSIKRLIHISFISAGSARSAADAHASHPCMTIVGLEPTLGNTWPQGP